MNQPEYLYNPYTGMWQPNPAAMPVQAPAAANGRNHLITGLVAGAAIAYLLSNHNVQQGISNTATKAWGTVRGEMEELKERVADLQAEVDYYRSQNKDDIA
ncbi:YtxH domain-containing protein [Kluyvera sp. STS39-E]|uniref:YtxH domain-containing protein n=1 Tax=Kluyvera sp. STS39-E TaxID=3234748 RepID=UPI0034C65B9E